VIEIATFVELMVTKLSRGNSVTDSLSLPDIGPEMSVNYPRPAGKGLEVVRLLAPGRAKEP